MKTLRIEFPVLAATDAHDLLDLVTEVEGVVAAMVSENALEVVVGTNESALLVREGVLGALALAGAGVTA